uniref:Uncharacterized protein n=1 Tax=Cucumis melo TaxID=3656 RepID=A0A9I9DPY3_CUCME
MGKPPISPENRPPLHRSDADDEDENVKQLNECSSFYLSLQVPLLGGSVRHLLLSAKTLSPKMQIDVY